MTDYAFCIIDSATSVVLEMILVRRAGDKLHPYCLRELRKWLGTNTRVALRNAATVRCGQVLRPLSK